MLKHREAYVFRKKNHYIIYIIKCTHGYILHFDFTLWKIYYMLGFRFLKVFGNNWILRVQKKGTFNMKRLAISLFVHLFQPSTGAGGKQPCGSRCPCWLWLWWFWPWVWSQLLVQTTCPFLGTTPASQWVTVTFTLATYSLRYVAYNYLFNHLLNLNIYILSLLLWILTLCVTSSVLEHFWVLLASIWWKIADQW